MSEHGNKLNESSDSPKAIHAYMLGGVILPLTVAYSPICSSVLLALMVPDTGAGVGVWVGGGGAAVAVGVGATTVMDTVSRSSPRAWSATVETPAEQPRNVVSTKPSLAGSSGPTAPDTPPHDFFSETPDVTRNMAGRSGGL